MHGFLASSFGNVGVPDVLGPAGLSFIHTRPGRAIILQSQIGGRHACFSEHLHHCGLPHGCQRAGGYIDSHIWRHSAQPGPEACPDRAVWHYGNLLTIDDRDTSFQDLPAVLLTELTASIVSAYVASNPVPTANLAERSRGPVN